MIVKEGLKDVLKPKTQDDITSQILDIINNSKGDIDFYKMKTFPKGVKGVVFTNDGLVDLWTLETLPEGTIFNNKWRSPEEMNNLVRRENYMNEGIKDIFKPRTFEDIEDRLKTMSATELDELSNKIPGFEEIEEDKRILKIMYRDMEAEAPETDEEANVWGERLSRVENKIEKDTKQRKLVDEYFMMADEKELAEYRLKRDLRAAKIPYEITNIEWHDRTVYIDVIIDGDELEFEINDLDIELIDFDGNIDFGMLYSYGNYDKNNAFIDKIKEYIWLDRNELSDFLDKNRA